MTCNAEWSFKAINDRVKAGLPVESFEEQAIQHIRKYGYEMNIDNIEGFSRRFEDEWCHADNLRRSRHDVR